MGENPDVRISIGLGGESPENITVVLSGSRVWLQGREVAYGIPESKRDELLQTLLPLIPSAQGLDDGTEKTP